MAQLRVKARAIDMLGRQQIAGIPTAIHELFKNAHDAYANNVFVDYFRSDALFVLRDDGIGMTEEEFLQRWLTVGTDSKVELGTLSLPKPDNVKTSRPILGEKGIGRLAIATIGPLVLVLTRSRRQTAVNGVTASLVHWGFFQIPGLDIDSIDIPVISLGKHEKPDGVLIELLKAQVLANTKTLIGQIPDMTLARICVDVESFSLNLSALYDEIKGPRLDDDDDQGTHFFILPADRIIENDMDDVGDYVASSLTKALLGFSNTMVPDAPKPPILASFRDHRLDGTINELIADRSFFTPKEFDEADHHFSGEFNEFGQFTGHVTVFGRPPQEFRAAWSNPSGRATECGPFRLNFAYVQGAARESRLDPEEYARIIEKLNRIGGLYLYRDDVRILPYGNSDYDFLDIERRRTKGAAYYFFSHRRMFGAIQTTRAANGGLVEKAGREGFQENRAYRQFKQMLENLLMQLAAEFFREDGVHADVYIQVKADLERNEEIRRRRDAQAKAKRSNFARELESFFEKVADSTPDREAEQLRQAMASRLRAAASNTDGNRAAAEMLRVEADVRGTMETLQERYHVRKPQGFGLTKPLLRDWASYREQSDRLQRQVFAPLAMHVEQIFGEVVAEFEVPLERRRRIDEAIQEIAVRSNKELVATARATTEETRLAQEAISAQTRKSLAALSTLIQDVRSEFGSTDTAKLKDDEFAAFRQQLQARISQGLQTEITALSGIRGRLSTLMSVDLADGTTQDELTEAMEERIESLRDEMEIYVELAQLGMAIGIVQHDFGDAIRTIRTDIRALQPWAKANKDLAKLHSSLRTAFEHLDGYLTLFTPLNKRLYRSKIDIRGENIALFLDSLFAERLNGSNIHLVATDAFRAKEVSGYPSTFFPVFVNLVENARHWVMESRCRPGNIILDVDGDDFTVSDTGSGILDRDKEAVFDYGFTRKGAGGQGLGLFISRQVLSRAGWELRLDPSAKGKGATFRLVPPPAGTTDDISLPAGAQ